MERELAKCVDFDVQDDDHGSLMLGGHFEYEGGGCQGLGYSLEIDFLEGFMGVFAVPRLQDVNGKSCWVTHDHGGISKIEPLHKKDGEPFDVKKWSSEKKAHAKV